MVTDPPDKAITAHPMAPFLRMDRIPHIWCPTCGIGTVVKCFATALERSNLDLDKVAICSGIGCTGRVAGYMNLDAFHTTHGRAIPFATGIKLSRPELLVTVFSGDGDLVGIGGNHFIHAARRNMDLLVVLVNNFIYGMTGGQNAPTTPLTARSSTMPFGNFERPFNLPYLAASCGASYVARWTSLHIRRLTKSFGEAIQRSGFRFIEVIAPCSTLYSLRPPQQARQRVGSHAVLSRQRGDPSRSRHERPGHRLPGRHRLREVRGRGATYIHRADGQALQDGSWE
jgi:2-oxoglutarate ferredoxin oxidoreductase subunit beta